MLDIDILEPLHDLTANTLYAAEVAHVPKLSPSETEALIARARQGERKARETLIVSCLSYALGVSRFVYHARRPRHDDLLDLVQVASERMMERLDRALATRSPAAYLRGMARRVILDYCTYHSELIQKPEYSLAVLEKLNPHPATVESLDTPLYHDGKRVRVDLIEATAMQSEPDAEEQRKRYTALYQAIHTLSKPHQEALVRLYGLFEQPMETASDIGRPELIRNRAYEARKKLQALLSEHLQRMLSDVPNEEE